MGLSKLTCASKWLERFPRARLSPDLIKMSLRVAVLWRQPALSVKKGSNLAFYVSHGLRAAFSALPLLALFGALLLSGCVSLPDPETSQIHEQAVIATLQPDGSSLGQTFISRRAGLNSLTSLARF